MYLYLFDEAMNKTKVKQTTRYLLLEFEIFYRSIT